MHRQHFRKQTALDITASLSESSRLLAKIDRLVYRFGERRAHTKNRKTTSIITYHVRCSISSISVRSAKRTVSSADNRRGVCTDEWSRYVSPKRGRRGGSRRRTPNGRHDSDRRRRRSALQSELRLKHSAMGVGVVRERNDVTPQLLTDRMSLIILVSMRAATIGDDFCC